MLRGIVGSAVVCFLVSLTSVIHAEPCIPTPEQCNGLDDDCDGVRDGMIETCYTFNSGCTQDPTTKQWTCTGICKPGLSTCIAIQSGGTWAGEWGECSREIGPADEICNSKDDDCDGTVDNDAACPGGSKCIDGLCAFPCGGTFPCPMGFICVDGYCVPDPCNSVACAAGWVCKGGECFDACANVTCGKYGECVKGLCVDTSCYNPKNKCPADQKCIQGTCQADPCWTVVCDAGEYCLNGKCVTICVRSKCATGESCNLVKEDGELLAKCVDDPCITRRCPTGYVCIDGRCVPDPCPAVKCERGEICEEGVCVVDLCELVRCPVDHSCEMGMCLSDNETYTTPPDLPSAESGCAACRIDQDERQDPHCYLLILSILLLAAVLRRAR